VHAPPHGSIWIRRSWISNWFLQVTIIALVHLQSHLIMVLPIGKALMMVFMILKTTIKCTQLIEEVTLVFYDIICKYSYTQKSNVCEKTTESFLSALQKVIFSSGKKWCMWLFVCKFGQECWIIGIFWRILYKYSKTLLVKAA
jgi:hypothetical protein